MFKRRKRITGHVSHDQIILMNLSLFIMLLAFFIVLNAISSYDEQKSGSVVESVQTTFSTVPLTPDISPSMVPSVQEAMGEGQTIDRIDALFRSQITAFDAVKDDGKGQMEVTLPLEVFTQSVMAIGQEDLSKASPDVQVKGKKFFLPTLVSLLKSDAQGVRYRMDMIFHVPENPATLRNRDPQTFTDTTRKGAALATQLQKSGLSARFISIGLEEGDASTIRVLFRPHQPFTPVAPEAAPAP